MLATERQLNERTRLESARHGACNDAYAHHHFIRTELGTASAQHFIALTQPNSYGFNSSGSWHPLGDFVPAALATARARRAAPIRTHALGLPARPPPAAPALAFQALPYKPSTSPCFTFTYNYK